MAVRGADCLSSFTPGELEMEACVKSESQNRLEPLEGKRLNPSLQLKDPVDRTQFRKIVERPVDAWHRNFFRRRKMNPKRDD